MDSELVSRMGALIHEAQRSPQRLTERDITQIVTLNLQTASYRFGANPITRFNSFQPLGKLVVMENKGRTNPDLPVTKIMMDTIITMQQDCFYPGDLRADALFYVLSEHQRWTACSTQWKKRPQSVQDETAAMAGRATKQLRVCMPWLSVKPRRRMIVYNATRQVGRHISIYSQECHLGQIEKIWKKAPEAYLPYQVALVIYDGLGRTHDGFETAKRAILNLLPLPDERIELGLMLDRTRVSSLIDDIGLFTQRFEDHNKPKESDSHNELRWKKLNLLSAQNFRQALAQRVGKLELGLGCY